MKQIIKHFKAIFQRLDGNKASFYMLDERADVATYKFLTTYHTDIVNPVKYPIFTVKLTTMSKAYMDKQEVIMLDLIGETVELQVLVKHYNFTSRGKKIYGWYMKLIDAHATS